MKLVVMRRADLFTLMQVCPEVRFMRIGSLWMDVVATNEQLAVFDQLNLPYSYE